MRRDYPFEVMESVSSCTKSGRMSRKSGIGEIPIHHQVISGDIDEIQHHRYHMNRRTFFLIQVKMYHRYHVRGFAWTWMALRARNPSPSGLATLNPQNTCHGPRPEPKVRAGSGRAPYVPRSRGHEERSAAGREKNATFPSPSNIWRCWRHSTS